ncbi:hypothetical protein KFL_002130150 [Klebsormidium nitens]|uniref:Uncharacterized protein n=1 Tax=Klebsormidium nitens TaxID=105231 RepID=A0A1Y1I696_KLENI|nr:hypothetical protein KFL_002130150 [Klebsormidium nitens]|eukprot:GAQ84939.1 hypothetical protein KFL_002130150 [Klebsormidium nitens]
MLTLSGRTSDGVRARQCNSVFGRQTRRIVWGQHRAERSREAPPRCLSSESPEYKLQKVEINAPARRTALLLAGAAFFSSLTALVADQSTAHAAPVKPPAVEEVPEIVKEMLERSKLNKAKYDKERLDDYNRRNFSDYFEFTTGSKNPKKMTETDKAMLKWLEANRKK